VIEYVTKRRLFCLNVQAGIVLCCLGCAIFGITEVPTDGIDFDTSDFGYSSTNNAGQPAVPTPTAAPYIPPPPPSADVATEQPAATLAPETGQGDSNTGSGAIPTPTVESAPVDLLNDAEQGQTSPPQETKSGEFHDLD
jgi:hypothetical protein